MTLAATRRKPRLKPVLGVLGALTLCLCGVALFSSDPDDNKKPETDRSAEVAAVRQAATGTPRTEATGTEPATTKPATTQPTTARATPTKPVTRPPSPKPVYYADCDAAPGELTRSDPGYRKALDRDGDGVACESGGDDDEPVEEDEPTSGTDPRFRTCAAANDAGYGDYVQGVDPEYDWYRDRDGDGVVCET
ncbi:Excalibur calcium-binding domain-containing protein [Actinoplanes philippinensis]|uniref:Excalibur calcium-binding domain-containing protein n=2 Tax=Actinoplanes philippinensis TaxID=35752 RepID=A0A1I2MRT7_9ACTN|nr:Excalibur calcium-binding domain-containing protein [Actinoplanes philippinensis]